MSPGPPLARDARVLVRLPGWLGDFVMSEPLVRALEAHVVPGRLTLLGRAAHLALLEGRFAEARRVTLEEHVRTGLGRQDAAVLCTGSFRSALEAWRARIPRRIGFARDGRAWLLSDALVPARERGGVPLGLGRAGGGRRYLPRPLERSLTELAGLVGVPVREPRPVIHVRDAWLAAARARRARLGLAPGEPFLLANVGARAGSAKGVPPERFAAWLAPLASRSRLPLVLVGGPGEEASVEAVRSLVPAAKAALAPPAELPELAALCAEARLVLTADAGPRHVARAVGAAVVCLAGPTDPRHTAGLRERERLVRKAVVCGPCHRERCPLVGERRHVCMTAIEPELALAAALALL
jgi:lipopolysaccharide heptosyltransferase II